MSVSQRPPPSSIDVSDLPVRVAEAVAGMAAVCRRQFGPDRSAEGFEEAERRVREGVHALGCEVLGAFVEDRDDGPSRIERDGQCWFRVAAPAFARARFAEDDHDHARSGEIPAGALPQRREPGIVRAGG